MRLNKGKNLRNTSLNPMPNCPMHSIALYDAAYDFMEIFFKRDTEFEIKKEVKRRAK